ncbi:transcriptional regulator, partial [Coxiella-like endosymbiont of Rhipicephalus sanguineus]|nr:transcriptional regulator [Coxiella-like endosymbiont of Rhipicephalus sanguineus]
MSGLARAKRVQAVREMTQLSRREFAKKRVSPTRPYSTRKAEKHTLLEKLVRLYIKVLLNLGVHCSY